MTTTATIDGNNSLQQIEAAIAGEEALATKFVKSEVKGADKKGITNVVTFEDQDDVPNAIRLLAQTAPPPDGFSKQWSGVMLVRGKNQAVTLYRRDGD